MVPLISEEACKQTGQIDHQIDEGRMPAGDKKLAPIERHRECQSTCKYPRAS